MTRKFTKLAAIAACVAVAGAGLTACDDDDDLPFQSSKSKAATFIGARKLTIDGKSVNVSCSGKRSGDGPVVILLHGGGDSLTRMAPFQKTIAKKNRVCSYDRLGAGASDKPDGLQTFASTGKILTGVLDKLAGDDTPVVLAGHSMGGLIAARYAPDHQKRVKGVVLMDATPPSMLADMKAAIPAGSKGPAGQLLAENLVVFKGEGPNNPEKLQMPDGPVGDAGSTQVEVIKHGTPYLAALPGAGPKLEAAWTAGERKWLKLSSNSHFNVAEKSDHYIYEKQPDIAVRAIERVSAKVEG